MHNTIHRYVLVNMDVQCNAVVHFIISDSALYADDLRKKKNPWLIKYNKLLNKTHSINGV